MALIGLFMIPVPVMVRMVAIRKLVLYTVVSGALDEIFVVVYFIQYFLFLLLNKSFVGYDDKELHLINDWQVN